MQVLVVSAGVGLFFVAFGMLAISAHIYEQWGVEPAPGRTRSTLLDHELLISASLVKVAVGIANFTGLYYSIALLTGFDVPRPSSSTTSVPNCVISSPPERRTSSFVR